MKKRAGDRFEFRPELGKRLRELRLRAGLTQQKLAVAMGSRRKGNHTVVSRLENGRMANPGIGLVADYLRACRAGFADIQSVLDSYTRKPTVIEVETQKALVKVREFLPAEIDRAVERLDRGVVRRAEEKRERMAWDKARQELVGQLWQEMLKRPELGGVEQQRLGLWQSLVRQFASIVDHAAPESDECRKQVEALANDEYHTRHGRDPALVRRLAEVVIPRWEELRRSLGPHPLG